MSTPTRCLGLHHDENLHLGAASLLAVCGGSEVVITPLWRDGEPQPRWEVSLETDAAAPRRSPS
jgi:hypothetical protein